MSSNSGSGDSWNIFARVFDRILHKHGNTLWQLTTLAGIHPEKIRRIQQSLHQTRFNVLSPQDLEKVAAACGFTPDEIVQIRAAILATAIEKMLMDRINKDDALAAGEQIYPILYKALKKHEVDPYGLGEAKGASAAVAMQPPSIEPDDEALEPVIEGLEAANLLLYLADTAEGEEGAQYARLARARFLAALSALEAMDGDIRSHQPWLVWHAETLSGLAHAEKRLAQEKPSAS